MPTLLYPFLSLSALGLVLSLIVHVSALLGINLGQKTFLLHMGIFVVWIPTVLVMMKVTKDCKRSELWQVALRGCPDWMKKVTFVFFIYAIVNFAIFIFTTSSHPNPHSGNTVQELRGFSGHWMAFYSVAFAVIYSAIQGKDKQRRCLNGHAVGPTAKYCEQCGSLIREGI